MSASECVCSCMYKCESVFVYGYESEWECVCLCECINALESVYDCVRLCMNASESVYICVYMYLWFSILFSSLPSGDLQKLCPRKCSQWMVIFCFTESPNTSLFTEHPLGELPVYFIEHATRQLPCHFIEQVSYHGTLRPPHKFRSPCNGQHYWWNS